MGESQRHVVKLKTAAFVFALLRSAGAYAQKPALEIYGFAQADAIVDFKVNNPDWFEVKRPSSGVIAVSPGNVGIAVVSPPLDDAGNSVRAKKAIRDISNALNGNPYGATGRRATAN